MYISRLTIENFRCFGGGDGSFELPLKPGLTALVGPNDVGKTAVIDAMRFVMGTTDQEWYRLDDADFHHGSGGISKNIRIVCKFEGLTAPDKRAFVEYLTYGNTPSDPPSLYIHWTATNTGQTYRGRPYRRVEVHSGENGNGPTLAQEARELLQATYLRPLRDAEQALSAGRGSRLSQVLQHTASIRTGDAYEPGCIDPKKLGKLSVIGIGDLADTCSATTKASRTPEGILMLI